MKSDISYLAGLIDGEGYIGIRAGKSYVVVVEVANNSKELMDWLVNNFGGTVYNRGGARPNEELGYSWRISSKVDIAKLLPWVVSELIVKRVHAEVMLSFCARFNIGKNNVYSEDDRNLMAMYAQCMKILNSKGPGSNDAKAAIKELLRRPYE